MEIAVWTYPDGKAILIRIPHATVVIMYTTPDSHRITHLSARKRPAAALAAGVLGLALLLLVAAQLHHAWSSYEARLAETRSATSNMARALAAQGEGAIRIVDTVLASVVERIENDPAGASSPRLRGYLMDTVRSIPELHGLFVYGPDGRWIVTSLATRIDGNNSDREYFQYHLNNTDRRVHIGVPVRSKSTGVWILPVSRRLGNPDGSFAGVVLGTMRVDFFAELYDSFDVGRSGAIFLSLDDGTLVYRRPFNAALPGTRVNGPVYHLFHENGPVGSAMLRSKIDQVERLYSYRHMDTFPLVVASAQSKDEILAEWYRSTGALAVGSLVAILFIGWLGKRLVGQIILRDRLEHELSLAGTTLEAKNAELRTLASVDGLTGLANRRTLDAVLARELSRARRSGTPLSLIMVDVDYFKQFNDRYGHVAGDECLRMVGSLLLASLGRPADVAARYGGEEFAVLLPDTGKEGADKIAERVRAGLVELGIDHTDNPSGVVTLSGGVYTFDAARDASLTREGLIARADERLYAAKQGGRNRIASDLTLPVEGTA